MGKIEIYFVGVCTFFEDYSEMAGSPGQPPVHRMVLVDGDRSSVVIHGEPPIPITPHLAHLAIDSPIVAVRGTLPPKVPGTEVYNLNGTSAFSLSVANASSTQWTNNAGCLPHLQDAVSTPLGPPSLPVIRDGQAACYADFTVGTIDGFQIPTGSNSAMGISRVTLETEGNPVLSIAGPDDVSGTLELECLPGGPALVFISNQPEHQGRDAEDDFILNFLTVAEPPSPSSIRSPDKVECPASPRRLVFGDAGPGCSNTNYP
jgi:hypothetical protein